MTAPAWLTARPIAHRGLHDIDHGIIENTTEAAAAAILGGFAIECDVTPAADGVVVFHDGLLDRMTHDSGPVLAKSMTALARTRFRRGETHISSLDDFLRLIDGRVPVFVEVKAGPNIPVDGFVDAIAAALNAYSGQVAVMSFSPVVMVRMKTLCPSLPHGLVSKRYDDAHDRDGLTGFDVFARRHLLSAVRFSPQFIAYDVGALPALAPDLWRRTGLPLLTWTVRTPENLETAKAHADQIIFEGFRPEPEN